MSVDYDPVKKGFKFDRDESFAEAVPFEEMMWAEDEGEELPLADEE
jgi:hypothetical protein